jgi:hypothetical protein
MAEDKELRNFFVLKKLNEHGGELIMALRRMIVEKKLRREDILHDSISTNIFRKGNDWVLQVIFQGYGRAIEIRWHKDRKNQAVWEMAHTNRLLFYRENRQRIQRPKRKDTRWYAKTAYGMLNPLIAKLSYGFTEEVIARLKSELEIAAKYGGIDEDLS